MTRWTLVLVVSGCSITVESDDKATIGDGTPEDQTPSTPGTGDPVDPPTGTTPDPGQGDGCDGVYPGVYGGAADGDLEAEVVSAEMLVYVYSVSGDGFLDGVLDLEEDGTMYGESQGFWAD